MKDAAIALRIQPWSHRTLSVRLRVAYRHGVRALRPLELDRPLGLPVGDDVPFKRRVDLFVDGFAYAPRSGSAEGSARIRAGGVDRTIRVFGPRRVTVVGDRMEFSRPVPFERVRLGAEAAFGGQDAGYYYARNPVGKGFAVDIRSCEGLELPCLEEGGDLLSPERLLVAPDDWWTLPVPALTDPVPLANFPRSVLLGGAAASLPFPRDERLPEIRSGDLSRDADARTLIPSDDFAQEAPRRSQIDRLEPGMSLVISGCSPTRDEVAFRAPEPLAVRVTVEGRSTTEQAEPQAVWLRPETEEMSITYALELALPRAFIPGLHRRIPISVTALDTEEHYQAPEPILTTIDRRRNDRA